MVPEKGMKLKHYTYKVTFPGMPWYYWGVHTDNGKPYYGSPTTHRWIWKFYECEVQILEWFEDRKEAERVEDRLIKATIKDPHCLNEHYGGHFSEEVKQKGRETLKREKLGLYDPSNQFDKSEAGKIGGAVAGPKTYDLKMGIHAPGVAQQAGLIGGAVTASIPGHLQSISSLPHQEKDENGMSLHFLKTLKAAHSYLYEDPDHPELGQHHYATLKRLQRQHGYPSGTENKRRVYPADQ
jgi:hypothetical protein